jgi:GNAT superfamily N-acetyltransferase
MEAIELRPSVATDREFLFAVHCRALRDHVAAAYGRWDDAEQRAMFDRGFVPGRDQIVHYGGADAGFVRTADDGNAVFIGLIELLPEFQRRGIGTALIQRIISEAHARGRPVRLQVFTMNPARRLYERLGFLLTGATRTHLQMEKAPP